MTLFLLACLVGWCLAFWLLGFPPLKKLLVSKTILLLTRLALATEVLLISGLVHFGWRDYGGAWEFFSRAHILGLTITGLVFGRSANSYGNAGHYSATATLISFFVNLLVILVFFKLLDLLTEKLRRNSVQ